MRISGEAPVVVGVNGTAAGLAAVRLGAREAVARGRPLRVVHVFGWSGAGPVTPAGRDGAGGPPHTGGAYTGARRAAGAIVAAAVTAARRSTPTVQVSGEVLDGQPVRTLLQQSRAADMMLLGDDDLASVPAPAIDSVLIQVVARAWCPVVVARGLRPPAGPLLAAVDGSPGSVMALRHAAAEARCRRVRVDPVHVVERAGTGAEEAGRRVLAEALAAVPELTGVHGRLLIGDPAGAIVRASRHARMVIVSPRGSDGAALLGQVARELLRRCACPTVFVHGATAAQPRYAGTVPGAGALAS